MTTPVAAPPPRVRREPLPVRLLLIGIALGFLLLFLVLPLVAVFIEALRGGVGAYFAAITERDAVSAIGLTLLVAVIAVPPNLVFEIGRAPCRGRVGPNW